MKKVFVTFAILLLAGNTALAQSTGVVVQQTRVQSAPGVPLPPPPDGNFLFVAAESFEGKVVKGAPYSAEAVTEHVQVLGDGNRIVNRFNSSIYRDGEGRTRREQTLKVLNNMLGAGHEPLRTIVISDPVAGVTYSLDTRTQTATKSVPFKFELGPRAITGASREGGRFEFRIAAPSSGPMIATPPEDSQPHPPNTRVMVERTEQFSVPPVAAAGNSFVFKSVGPAASANHVKLDLGKQIIEGVEAEGTRTTFTIPAGEIGNERPIEIVTERWYSPELQLFVMTRTSDPRSGETTYKLTNINRSEPARSLFEVPADYTVKDSIHAGPMMPRVRKLARPEEQ